MPDSLPTVIDTYFAASNRSDIAGLVHCFAPNATVHDEGRTHRGHEAIAAWQTEAQKKFEYSIEPLDTLHEGNHVTVTTNVVGNFPGSPVQLEHIFVLADDKIESLVIR